MKEFLAHLRAISDTFEGAQRKKKKKIFRRFIGNLIIDKTKNKTRFTSLSHKSQDSHLHFNGGS